jgi:hypothetical protein
MMGARFSGMVKGGRLPKPVSADIAAALMKLEGCTAEIIIKKSVKRRSGNQNAYYFGVVVRLVTDMLREAGNYVDDEDTHEFLKQHVGKLMRIVVDPEGVVHKALGSTAKLSTMEFETYLAQVRAWAAEFGLQIPLPNETLNQP